MSDNVYVLANERLDFSTCRRARSFFFKWLISKCTLCVECMYLPLMIFIINIVNNILLSCTYNKCALSQRIVCYKWLKIIMMYLNSINHIFFSNEHKHSLSTGNSEHNLQLHTEKITFYKCVIEISSCFFKTVMALLVMKMITND